MEEIHFANENIKIDLHIHSIASEYKDGDIVKDSNIGNIEVLINSLEKNNISLFSITDHNRFDYALYQKLKERIATSNIIKKVLPGVEFDVKLDNKYPKGCHVVCIFDDKDEEKIRKIEEKIFSIKKLEKETDVYTIDEFENILRQINTKTILIVHQKQSLENNNTESKSLSGATDQPSFFLKTGYFDAMEYSTNKQEGILKSSLNDIDVSFSLLTGSDCHQWEAYPYRDKTCQLKERAPLSSFRCLPSFKGLLMAFSSFSSRANRGDNSNSNYIESININGERIPLSNGINAIIGDNGSGKTMIIDYLCTQSKQTYYKHLVDSNEIKINYSHNGFQQNDILYIKQGDIIQKVRKGELFNNEDVYDPITTKQIFENSIKEYFENIKSYVTKNILYNEQKKKLESSTVKIEIIERNVFFPIIDTNLETTDLDSIKKRKDFIELKLNELTTDYGKNKEFYEKEKVDMYYKEVLKVLNKMLKIIEDKYLSIENDNKVKGIIIRIMSGINTKYETLRSTEEKQKTDIIANYNNFKECILTFIKISNEKNDYPEFPQKVNGVSKKQKGSYLFIKKAKFDNMDLKEHFYKECFNSCANSEDKIKSIKTKDEFASALKNIKNLEEINKYNENTLQKFINAYSEEETFISEVTSENIIGNTPGELSLVFYKYTIEKKQFSILAIDQPEDDINPKRINDILLEYLKQTRDKKQVLIVTHNPLLVINLDVDNVLFLNKTNDKVKILYGALEYTNEDYSILDLIKNNLDGGYKAIERRIKKYDRNEN